MKNVPKYVLKRVDNKQFNIKKICIIYVYYERNNEQKNQTNLSFFIKYGLDKSRWRDMDITTLIIINGKQCEVLIPERSDIIVLKEDNCLDWEGWYNGIIHLEKIYGKKIYNVFSHLCLINASAIGPIYDDGKDKHWLDPFLNKIKENKSVICCPIMNLLPNVDLGGPGMRVLPVFSLIKIDKEIINKLLNTQISPICKGSINDGAQLNNNLNYTNTVLGKKKDKVDAILTGEYGLSRVLLDSNYNISALHCNNNSKIRCDHCEVNNHNIIFIKNQTRAGNNFACKPVLYDYCINFMNSKLYMENIFKKYNKFDSDYLSLDVPPNGIAFNSNFKWNCKEEYYNIFGRVNETILWPKQKQNNKSVVIYCHYDKDNIVQDYVIQSLKTFIILNYDIIFCTSSNKIKNVDFPFKVNYYNNKNILKKGKDIFMFYDSLKKIDLKKYTWFTFLNDSILLPVHGINNMRLTIEEYRKNNDFWGLYLSNECQIHLCSCHIEFNIKCINKLIQFLETSLKTNFMNKEDIIAKVEVKIVENLSSAGYKYDGVVRYDQLKQINHCIMFHPDNIYKYIDRTDVFGIKWKYISNYLDFDKVHNYYLNYLMRFLKTGNIIPGIRR